MTGRKNPWTRRSFAFPSSSALPTRTECAQMGATMPPVVGGFFPIFQYALNAMMNSPRSPKPPGVLAKLLWSLPWLSHYPLWRVQELLRRRVHGGQPCHLIFLVANHFEPAWKEDGTWLDWSTQLARVDQWMKLARSIGRAVQDYDRTPFRHTYFYPAEQYYAPLLEKLAELQSEGLGEVEIHLHHGVDQPDTAANCRQTLLEHRDILAEKHQCLSRRHGGARPCMRSSTGTWRWRTPAAASTAASIPKCRSWPTPAAMRISRCRRRPSTAGGPHQRDLRMWPPTRAAQAAPLRSRFAGRRDPATPGDLLRAARLQLAPPSLGAANTPCG